MYAATLALQRSREDKCHACARQVRVPPSCSQCRHRRLPQKLGYSERQFDPHETTILNRYIPEPNGQTNIIEVPQ